MINTYEKLFQENDSALMYSEMLKIFEAAKQNKDITKQLNDWHKKYHTLQINKWPFRDTKTWILKEQDSVIRENLLRLLEYFNSHLKNRKNLFV